MNMKPNKITPMFEQYFMIKEENKDSLLFYRVGDFYELFFEDAEIAAQELQITLTSHSRDVKNPIPMCGVPWHSVQPYINQLVKKGYKVAICDQTEEATASKGIVKRAVTQVITAGTLIRDDNLISKEHNYLAALYINENNNYGAMAWVDVSTGTWKGFHSKTLPELWQWVQKVSPKELLLCDRLEMPANYLLENSQLVRIDVKIYFNLKRNAERILEAQKVQELEALGLADKPELVQACGALLVYLNQTQKQDTNHLSPFIPFDLSKYLIIDDLTEKNLEIFVRLNGQKGKGTLWQVMDETITAMGGRLLQDRLCNPWRELETILNSQAVVTYFLENKELRQTLRNNLKFINDIERISTRISLNRTNPKDFVALKLTLEQLPKIHSALIALQADTYATNDETKGSKLPISLYNVYINWDNLSEHAALLTKALVDSPPNTITEGGIFKTGYNSELDELIDLLEHGQQKIKNILLNEQKKTGIARIKLGYNKIFGYYFEITNSQLNKNIPEYFIRRQTLANAERFVTIELKELEENITLALEKRKNLEYKLFQELQKNITAIHHRLLFIADLIATLDFWQSLAETAQGNNWAAPTLDNSYNITIKEGRHPVVESIIGSPNFIPNDLYLDHKKRQCIITGPNMSGKSTILRQTAIIVLLAQIGSYVPATKAHIGIVDKIFSRVGASDNIAQGQSTFMVEMMETARILRQSSKHSLVILDEIGRGTSTYDGLSLAWAVMEELNRKAGGNIRTLFATHYHELTSLEGRLDGIFTMNVAIRYVGGQLLFLHRLIPGPSDRSYGIEVAKLAGVPLPVVQRAKEILAKLEKTKLFDTRQGHFAEQGQIATTLPGIEIKSDKIMTTPPPDLPNVCKELPHPFIITLQELEPENITPIQALKLVSEWKLLWGS